MQELGTMATSLPIAYDSSVFLVVDEQQSHCMRALITGPKGTPYQVTHKFNLFNILLEEAYTLLALACSACLLYIEQ
jgi:hypothetical protein